MKHFFFLYDDRYHPLARRIHSLSESMTRDDESLFCRRVLFVEHLLGRERSESRRPSKYFKIVLDALRGNFRKWNGIKRRKKKTYNHSYYVIQTFKIVRSKTKGKTWKYRANFLWNIHRKRIRNETLLWSKFNSRRDLIEKEVYLYYKFKKNITSLTMIITHVNISRNSTIDEEGGNFALLWPRFLSHFFALADSQVWYLLIPKAIELRAT